MTRMRYGHRAAWFAACFLIASGAAADGRPTLRGDVVAEHDALTFGDLIADAPENLTRTPLFRSPALGRTGTIQTSRILEAAAAAGVAVESGGRLQILVTRLARQVGVQEVEAAVRTALEASAGLDPRTTGIVFEGAPPNLVLSPDVKGSVVAGDLTFDQRNRRFTTSVWVGPSSADRPAAARLSGSVIDIVEVAVVNRALARGEALANGDFTIERRPRESVPSDALAEAGSLAGRVARRAFAVGAILRNGDLIKPELVARGDIVTVVYTQPGLSLTMRAKASEGGALGDTVAIANPQSKKPLQATIIGPGKVSVNLAPPGPLAAAASSKIER
jgi:flagella basal body P-ring formation protein FlgA